MHATFKNSPFQIFGAQSITQKHFTQSEMGVPILYGSSWSF